MLAISRVSRTRPPLAEMSIRSGPSEPLNWSVHLGHYFPLAFAGIAIGTAIAGFLNSKFVGRLGMRVISHGGISRLRRRRRGLADGREVADVAVAAVHGAVTALMMFSFGLMIANFTALAMEPQGHIAGTASSMYGSITTLLGIGVGMWIGQHSTARCCRLRPALPLHAGGARGSAGDREGPAVSAASRGSIAALHYCRRYCAETSSRYRSRMSEDATLVWRDRHSLDRPGLHRHDRRRAYSAGHRMRSGGRRRDAFRETSWTPLHIRYSLFLVLARAIRLGNLSCRHALERKLPLVHSRRPFIRVRLDWPFGNSTALAILGEVAHNRAGPFLRLDADRLLCGQWKAASSLEGSAARNVLALAFPDRGTAAHSSAATPPRGACLTRALNFCPGLNFPIRPRRPKTP